MRKSLPKLLLLFMVLIYCSNLIFAQGVTTASIQGAITDQNGTPLPAATILAVHQPTGTQYGVTSRNNGKYNLLNLKVGGPYTITISYVGYETQKKEDVYLQLGQALTLNFKMTTSTVNLSEVTVLGTRSAIISSDRTGASQRVSSKQIQEIPTISRSLLDLTKASPFFSGASYSAAGRSGRYNNIQLNGTQFNDLFGLGSGAPGSNQGANAISLDEIQEFQIVVAPFDVRYGGFTGGGINAITRSGSNIWEGSVYGFGRNQGFAGVSPDENKKKLANFNNYQEGLRIGGPIIQDKLFFFVSGEVVQYNYPWENISLTPQGNPNAASYANQMKSILSNTYGFNPGSEQNFDASNPNEKIFARFDWNLNEKNKLTFNYSYLNAKSDNDYSSTRNGNNTLSFDSYLYLYHNRTSNGVLQLNSQIGNSMSNELILGYTTILDNRVPFGNAYPLIEVDEGNFKMYAGPDRYSSANMLNQANVELTDNFMYSVGDHLLTFGTHNEFFAFKNLFMRSFYGYYTFAGLSALQAGTISNFQKVSSRTSDLLQAASFSANQYGVYAQDEWTGIQNLKITLGIRFDLPTFPTSIPNNDSVSYYFPGYSTANKPKANLLISPRLGVNYDVNGDHVTQIRGGIGIFSGRVPYVWMSNNYGNNGTYYAEVSGTPTAQFQSSFIDPYNQPTANQLGLPTNLKSEIDMVDPNLKMPQVLRFDAAIDRQLPYDFVGTVEFLYSKSINDMSYKLVNLKPSTGTSAYEANRTLFSGYNNGNGNFYQMLYLENTSQGYQYNIVAQAERNVLRGLSINAGYAYGRAFDINSVESSQANSQMAYNPIAGSPNDPPLETSDYEVRNRIFGSITYTEEFFKDAPTSISLFYNGQSGRPYSLTVYGDVNGDGYNQNDLFYIPKNDADIELGSVDANGVYTPDQQMYSDLDNFIANNDYLSSHRGQMFKRNATTAPWNNSLDMRIVQALPVMEHRVEITLDILNILNLLNNSWGYYYTLVNPTYTIVSLKGKDSATGRNVYSFSKPTNNTPWSADNLLSRWYMQLGLRFTL